MDINEAASKILSLIGEWSKNNQRLVIGIDGIPGVGKTTLLDRLTKQNSLIEPVYIDNFMSSIEFRKTEVVKLSDQNDLINFFIYHWFDYQDLTNLIEKFKSGKVKSLNTEAYRTGKRSVPKIYNLSKPILIVEGILLFHPKLLDGVWDKRIYLDGDEQQIKQRRVARERKRWGKSYISEDDPTSWLKFILEGIKQYQQKYNPKQRADLVLNISPKLPIHN